MRAIAIITARGGSKRIPKKNIKNFCGKPIIAYSIEAAMRSHVFEEVMVSTDSEEIAEISASYGASVPFTRSALTSGDYATTDDVVIEVIEKYISLGQKYDIICCIYPTAPFITPEILQDAYKLLIENEPADSVMPLVRYSFPPQRAMVIRDGLAQYQWPENATKRSQDLEPVYHDCGQFYLCRTDSLLKYRDLLGQKAIPLEIPEECVQDIDNISDWMMAEMKYKLLNKIEEGNSYV